MADLTHRPADDVDLVRAYVADDRLPVNRLAALAALDRIQAELARLSKLEGGLRYEANAYLAEMEKLHADRDAMAERVRDACAYVAWDELHCPRGPETCRGCVASQHILDAIRALDLAKLVDPKGTP